MRFSDDQHRAVKQSQNTAHGDGHDYVVGSPHLRHPQLRSRIDSQISETVAGILAQKHECRVLEVGAGHGSFTDTVLTAGGTATVTEMSTASFNYLSVKFSQEPRVQVIHDIDGSAPFSGGSKYDVILLISVIHHIPDYIDTVTRLCDTTLQPGGAVLTFQDPLWYPRQSRWERMLSRAPYFIWRLTQGEFRRGIATRWRRLRGVYSETDPSDLVEYHVVRQGVDEIALYELFRERFTKVEIDRYFSTQSPQLQSICEKNFPCNTFGIAAYGRGESKYSEMS